METVFIVIEDDSNDESRINAVFSSESKALAYKDELLKNGYYSYVWVEEWDVWK